MYQTYLATPNQFPISPFYAILYPVTKSEKCPEHSIVDEIKVDYWRIQVCVNKKQWKKEIVRNSKQNVICKPVKINPAHISVNISLLKE